MKRAIDDLLLFLPRCADGGRGGLPFSSRLLIAISMAFDAAELSWQFSATCVLAALVRSLLPRAVLYARPADKPDRGRGIDPHLEFARRDRRGGPVPNRFFSGKQAVTALFPVPRLLSLPSFIGFSLLLFFAKLQIFGGFSRA